MTSGRRKYDTEAWKEGFTAYLSTYEVRLHKRTDTYGGTLWPANFHEQLIPDTRQLQIAVQALEKTA